MNSKFNQPAIAPKPNPIGENESTETINSISRLDSLKTNKIYFTDDELITSLQNHRENRRARQVFEWETARRNIHDTRHILRGAA